MMKNVKQKIQLLNKYFLRFVCRFFRIYNDENKIENEIKNT